MYKITEVNEGDLLLVHEYFNYIFKARTHGLFLRPEGMGIAKVEAMIQEALNSSDSLFLLAKYQDESVVGTLTFNRFPKIENRHCGEFGMSVHPDHQRQELGAQLIAQMEAWAKAHEIRKIELQVWTSNAGAIRLYSRLGYLVEGVRRSAIIRDNQMIDVMLMGKLLEIVEPE